MVERQRIRKKAETSHTRVAQKIFLNQLKLRGLPLSNNDVNDSAIPSKKKQNKMSKTVKPKSTEVQNSRDRTELFLMVTNELHINVLA